jgi:hypothetical protein
LGIFNAVNSGIWEKNYQQIKTIGKIPTFIILLYSLICLALLSLKVFQSSSRVCSENYAGP